MDSVSQSQSILETLRTVEFRLGLKGYNVDEVDEYLEKAAVEAESLLEQLRTVNERLGHANERIGQLESEPVRSPGQRTVVEPVGRPDAAVSDDTLQRTLLLAQKFVEQTKRESEAEAAEVLRRAEDRAKSLLTQAEERARQVAGDAEQRLREEVSRLEGMRSRLAGDVEAMARHLEEERTRIRSSLAEVLKWIDERVQPSNALTAVRGRQEPPGGADAPAGNPASGSGREAAEDGGANGQRPSAVAGAGGTERSDGPGPRLLSAGAPAPDELFEAARRSE